MACRAVLGQQLDLYNVRDIDTSLGISLEKFVAAHKAWTSSDKLQPLLIDGVSVQDLCLTFELPGDLFSVACCLNLFRD